MANELQAECPTGSVVYMLVRDPSGKIWNTNTSAFETFNSANLTVYAITATEQSTTGYFTANAPSTATGRYQVVAKIQAGGTPALTDISAAEGDIGFVATKTVEKATEYIGATAAGKLPSGAGTGQENWQAFDGSASVDITVDSNGNRTTLVYH